MPAGIVQGAVNLNKDESSGVILTLKDVKASNSRLLDAVLSVIECGFEKVFHKFRLYRDVDVYDEHIILLCIQKTRKKYS
jgi:hypothetical protein